MTDNKNNQKRVVTYGTFDLFHRGHVRLLERAKALGDYLVVGVTSENYDKGRGKLNVRQNLIQRIENVKKSGLADEIIVEEYEGQKIIDILQNKIDIFAIGSDWIGKFDYIKEYCDVIYLERTAGVSSTELRNNNSGILKLGIVGNGRIAKRFVAESIFVSGVNIEGVFGRNEKSLKAFVKDNSLDFSSTNYSKFLKKVQAVYIASPHLSHYKYAKKALETGVHVLCEKPITLSKTEAKELYELASSKNLVLLEAIKTAYAPGFSRLVAVAKSGLIGQIVSLEATFTKLVRGELRELRKENAGGSMTELASYPLLAAVKILGPAVKKARFWSYYAEKNGVDLFTKIDLQYPSATATLKIGLGAKSEGDLIITGTKGYIYVPAPWWKTEYFEVRYENAADNKKYYYKFDGDGLRYELAEFVSLINNQLSGTYKLSAEESVVMADIIERHSNSINLEQHVAPGSKK